MVTAMLARLQRLPQNPQDGIRAAALFGSIISDSAAAIGASARPGSGCRHAPGWVTQSSRLMSAGIAESSNKGGEQQAGNGGTSFSWAGGLLLLPAGIAAYLGVWQVQRRQWKLDLIAERQKMLWQEPSDIFALDSGVLEYLPVTVSIASSAPPPSPPPPSKARAHTYTHTHTHTCTTGPLPTQSLAHTNTLITSLPLPPRFPSAIHPLMPSPLHFPPPPLLSSRRCLSAGLHPCKGNSGVYRCIVPQEWIPCCSLTLLVPLDGNMHCQARGSLQHDKTIYVGPRVKSSMGTAVSGHTVITPMHSDLWHKTVLVNRGWAPSGWRSGAECDQAAGPGEVEVSGALRLSEQPSNFVPDNNPSSGQWHWIDVPSIAEACGLPADTPMLEVYTPDTTSPAPPTPIDVLARRKTMKGPAEPEVYPKPKPAGDLVELKVMPKDHFNYAATWFSLSAITAAMAVKVLTTRKRPRRF